MFIIDEGKLFFGAAINYNNVCWVYPVQIKDIIKIGQDNYNQYLSLLCADIREIQSIMKKEGISEKDMPDNMFDYIMAQCEYSYSNDDDTFFLKLKEAFFTFIREEVHFLFEQQKILIGSDFSSRRVLTRENFFDFQNILRAQNALPTPEPIPENESPMARKFRLRREQVAEAKRKQAQRNGEYISLYNSISTLITLNPGVTFENVKDLTIYQFKDLLARAQAKYKYDLDIRMIAAGADPKKIKPKHWFGKIE
jgi:hypothetical protein